MKDAARPLENVAELLAREPDGGGVDQRLHLVDVVAQNAEEQRLVTVMQRVQSDEFFERIGQLPQVGQNARDLLVLAVHVGRQQSAQARTHRVLSR